MGAGIESTDSESPAAFVSWVRLCCYGHEQETCSHYGKTVVWATWYQDDSMVVNPTDAQLLNLQQEHQNQSGLPAGHLYLLLY